MITGDGVVVHEARFEHPIERVWNAIVSPDELAIWLMPNDFEPVVGHRFSFFDAGRPSGRIDAEVLELDPPQRIRWRWMIDGAATTVTITLRRDGTGTVLHLEHADLPLDPRAKFDSGWVGKLRDLSTVVSTVT